MDNRGFDLRVDNFKTQLINMLNESNLPISTIMYIIKDVFYDVSAEYNRIVNQQYKDFCEEAKKESEQKAKEEEENSSSSND